MDQQTSGEVALAPLVESPAAGESAPAGTLPARDMPGMTEASGDGRAAARAAAQAGGAKLTRVAFADVMRVDTERREVELCATSEREDSYGTVFSYEASKGAFDRWEGNVREMHDPHKAVGQKLDVRYDDAEHRIFVRVRISLGAEDTWQKVLDGTLRGASIGARNVVWQKQLRPRDGELCPVDVAVRYDLVELSLVDNPSNPDAFGVTIVRDALPDATLLDTLDRDAPEGAHATYATYAAYAPAAATTANPASARATLRTPAPLHGRPGKEAVRPPHTGATEGDGTRAARPAAATRDRGPFSANEEGYADMGVPARAVERPTSALGMTPDGNARGRFHDALLGIARGCGCALCEMAAALYDEAGGADGDDGEGASVSRAQGVRRRDSAVVRALAAGAQSSTARLDAVRAGMREVQALVRAAIERAAGADAELRRRLEALEAQPLPGGPAARPVEKSLALAPHATRGDAPAARDDAIHALQSLAGRLTDPQAQIAVAAELIRLQQER